MSDNFPGKFGISNYLTQLSSPIGELHIVSKPALSVTRLYAGLADVKQGRPSLHMIRSPFSGFRYWRGAFPLNGDYCCRSPFRGGDQVSRDQGIISDCEYMSPKLRFSRYEVSRGKYLPSRRKNSVLVTNSMCNASFIWTVLNAWANCSTPPEGRWHPLPQNIGCYVRARMFTLEFQHREFSV